MVDTFRRSGLAGIYRAPRNLDQIGAVARIILFFNRHATLTGYFIFVGLADFKS